MRACVCVCVCVMHLDHIIYNGKGSLGKKNKSWKITCHSYEPYVVLITSFKATILILDTVSYRYNIHLNKYDVN